MRPHWWPSGVSKTIPLQLDLNQPATPFQTKTGSGCMAAVGRVPSTTAAPMRSANWVVSGVKGHEIDDGTFGDYMQRIDRLDFFRARGIDTSCWYYPSGLTVLARLKQCGRFICEPNTCWDRQRRPNRDPRDAEIIVQPFCSGKRHSPHQLQILAARVDHLGLRRGARNAMEARINRGVGRGLQLFLTVG